MNFKRMILIAVILISAVAIMFLTGCSSPGDSQQESTTQGSTTQEPATQESTTTQSIMSGLTFAPTTVSSNGTGTDGGYFYTFWIDRVSGNASMTMDGANGYTTTCSNLTGGFVAGKGWATGSSNRVINFQGTYKSSYGGAFGLYGWTKNPLVEYYVIEHAGDKENPCTSPDIDGQKHTYLGWMFSDDGVYGVWKNYRVNKPSIVGNSNFWQYISVRGYTYYERDSGPITFQNHVNEWAKYGLNLGSHDYQILFTEMWSPQDNNGNAIRGQYVSGNSNGTIVSPSNRRRRPKRY